MSSFIKALNKNDLPDKKGRCVELKGQRIAIFNVGGAFFAIEDSCTHAGASLAEGYVLNNCAVECPWHGARFDLQTGKVQSLPASEPVRIFPVRLQGDDLEVEVQ